MSAAQHDGLHGVAYELAPPQIKENLVRVGRGTPMGELLRRYWQSEDGYSTIEIAGWWLSYLAFGLSYWLVTRDLGKRYHWLLQLPMLAVLNAAAIGIGYFSHSGLSGILLLVIAGVLPWLLPFWAGVAWLILQNFSLVPVFIYRVEGFDWFDALLQSGLYIGFSGFTFVTSLVALSEHPDAIGKAVNLGGAVEISINDLAERVRTLLGSASPIEHVPYTQAYGPGYEDMRRRVPDNSLAYRLVGFRPRTGVDDMILAIARYQRNE